MCLRQPQATQNAMWKVLKHSKCTTVWKKKFSNPLWSAPCMAVLWQPLSVCVLTLEPLFHWKNPISIYLHTSNVLSRKKCGCEDEAKAPTLHWHKLSFNLFTQRFLSYSSLFILFPSSLSGFREREHHHMWMIKPSETFSILSIIRELSQTPDFIIPFCMFRMFFFYFTEKIRPLWENFPFARPHHRHT